MEVLKQENEQLKKALVENKEMDILRKENESMRNELAAKREPPFGLNWLLPRRSLARAGVIERTLGSFFDDSILGFPTASLIGMPSMPLFTLPTLEFNTEAMLKDANDARTLAYKTLKANKNITDELGEDIELGPIYARNSTSSSIDGVTRRSVQLRCPARGSKKSGDVLVVASSVGRTTRSGETTGDEKLHLEHIEFDGHKIDTPLLEGGSAAAMAPIANE